MSASPLGKRSVLRQASLKEGSGWHGAVCAQLGCGKSDRSMKGATQEQKPDLKYITERQFSNSIKKVLTKKKRFFGLGGYIFTFDALLKSKTEKTLNHTMAQIFAEIVGVEWDKGAPKIREFKQPKANEMAIKLYIFFGSHLKVELEKNEKKPGELKTKILKKREGIVHVGGFEREHYETFWDTEIRGDEEAIKAYEKAQKRVDELKDLFVDVEKSISELKSQNGKRKVTVNQTVTVKKSHRFTEMLRIRKRK
ncbi:hypothetical protein Ddc_17095 [Ditylenchus destructor]|nr:hypothetical protein Ddc_17095 [Ditylenchus destructor]